MMKIRKSGLTVVEVILASIIAVITLIAIGSYLNNLSEAKQRSLSRWRTQNTLENVLQILASLSYAEWAEVFENLNLETNNTLPATYTSIVEVDPNDPAPPQLNSWTWLENWQRSGRIDNIAIRVRIRQADNNMPTSWNEWQLNQALELPNNGIADFLASNEIHIRVECERLADTSSVFLEKVVFQEQ